MTLLDIRDPEVQRKINSITKYPSIPTYHAIGERGVLTEQPGADKLRLWDETPLLVTEKIDGVNARIIMLPETDEYATRFIIGSREELLWAQGDIIRNPVHQIVDTLALTAAPLTGHWGSGGLTVFYLEVFGGATGPQARAYSNDKTVTGARLFDVMTVPERQLDLLITDPIEEIALWRDRGEQPFGTRTEANRWAGRLGVLSVPVLATVPAAEMPETIAQTYAWLLGVLRDGRTTVALGTTTPGKAEGVVVRADSRQRFIAKIRHQDYQRTMNFREALDIVNKRKEAGI